jgi:signal transduction histidine kinase
MWIDFPFITTEEGADAPKPIGILTIECHEDLRPEQFDALHALSLMTRGMLKAFENREAAARAAARVASQHVVHLLYTPIVNLGRCVQEYRRKQQDLPDLEPLNDRLEKLSERAEEIARRARNFLLLSAPEMQTDSFDIIEGLNHEIPGIIEEITTSEIKTPAVPIEWQVHCEEDHVLFYGDTLLLRLALRELIQNTWFMHEKKQPIRIELRLELDPANAPTSVRILYEDNGPGVPERLKDEIFKLGFTTRAARRDGTTRGTGFGLDFIRRICEAHGGTIVERGEEGQCARFILHMPLDFRSEKDEANVYDTGR